MTISTYSMTRHADERVRQRGVRTDALEFVLEHFDSDHVLADGRSSVWISSSGLKKLAKDGYHAGLVEKAGKLCLVLASNGNVVTVLNRPPSRSYRRH